MVEMEKIVKVLMLLVFLCSLVNAEEGFKLERVVSITGPPLLNILEVI